MDNEQSLKNKSGEWFLMKQENKFKKFLVPKVPLWLETYHLTLLTILWSSLVVVCFYFGKENQVYFWYMPVLVILQYITDILDGEVGRERDTGLVRWGFYVDHFLDFVFMTSIVIGYGIVLGFNIWIFLIYSVICGFLIHTFLLVSANNTFNISFMGIGPTEGRILFIVFHFVFMYEGNSVISIFLPYIAISSILILLLAFLSSQSYLWSIDMDNKVLKDRE